MCTHLSQKLLIIASIDVEGRDKVEELVRGHDVTEPRTGKERGDIGAVSQEELQSVGMRGLHRLAHVNEVHPTLVPKHVVLAEVSMD